MPELYRRAAIVLMPYLDDPDGTRFALLGESETIDDQRLYALYAYPAAISRSWVRSNSIGSIDGSAAIDGTSAPLGETGDRRLFQVLRELADVIVVGTGTAQLEKYAGVQMTVAQRQHRRDRGQSEIPPIALVSRSGRLDHNLPVFTRTEIPPLVLTCTEGIPNLRSQLGMVAEAIDCSRDDPASVDLPTALDALAERGLIRVLAEGGPTLMGSFIGQDLLDELCVTIAPMLVGGSASRIAAAPDPALIRMRFAHVITDRTGYLYARYTRG